jgi:hypothetical protein
VDAFHTGRPVQAPPPDELELEELLELDELLELEELLLELEELLEPDDELLELLLELELDELPHSPLKVQAVVQYMPAPGS